MRAGLIVVGVILLAVGIWVVVGHGSYTDTSTVAQIGSAKLTATHDRAIPSWVGIIGIVLGGLLAVGGIARRN
jgi:hypothetical protein